MPKAKSEKKFRHHTDTKKSAHKASSSGAANAKEGLRFNKDFGQHILKNPLVITSMIDKAALNATDTAIESASFSSTICSSRPSTRSSITDLQMITQRCPQYFYTSQGIDYTIK